MSRNRAVCGQGRRKPQRVGVDALTQSADSAVHHSDCCGWNKMEKWIVTVTETFEVEAETRIDAEIQFERQFTKGMVPNSRRVTANLKRIVEG